MKRTVYTIGHSKHPTERFIELLKRNAITAIADVRSQPYSRWNPQFNRDALRGALNDAGIAYVFLGRELGARSSRVSATCSRKRTRFAAAISPTSISLRHRCVAVIDLPQAPGTAAHGRRNRPTGSNLSLA